jgi:archaemetzincin
LSKTKIATLSFWNDNHFNAVRNLALLILLLVIISCNHNYNKQTIIHIKPLGSVDTNVVKLLKNEIESFYQLTCVVDSSVQLTNDVLAKSKIRYDASKILEKYKSNKNTLIITEVDMACKNEDRKVDEWGIFGLGYTPGRICILSTFRLKWYTYNKTLINSRIIKVSLHELGHNFGLPHCTNYKKCMMTAASGTLKQVDAEDKILCNKCNSFIVKNILK